MVGLFFVYCAILFWHCFCYVDCILSPHEFISFDYQPYWREYDY